MRLTSKLILVSLCLFNLFLELVKGCGHVPSGYQLGSESGHYFRVNWAARNWKDAMASCEAERAALAMPRTDQLARDLKNQIIVNPSGGSTARLWLGITNPTEQQNSSLYEYADNSPVFVTTEFYWFIETSLGPTSCLYFMWHQNLPHISLKFPCGYTIPSICHYGSCGGCLVPPLDPSGDPLTVLFNGVENVGR